MNEIKILIPLDEDREGEAGIIFTDRAIFHWREDDEFVFDIPYEEIKNVDYSKNAVQIMVVDEKMFEIKNTFLSGRRIYSCIMDVLEKLTVDKRLEIVTPTRKSLTTLVEEKLKEINARKEVAEE